MADNKHTENPEVPTLSTATNWPEFCSEMTNYAKFQVEYHKVEYFSISQSLFSKLMEWYKEIRKTNDESEEWAKPVMNIIDNMHIDLTLKTKEFNTWLEEWTDKCKGEEDMPCINNCGTEYMQTLYWFYRTRINEAKGQLNDIL